MIILPLYDFKCLDCGNVEEVLVKGITNKYVCKKCSSLNTKKLLAIFSVMYNSDGFHTTDYKQAGKMENE